MSRRMQYRNDETDDTSTSHRAVNETNETSGADEESPLAAFQHTGWITGVDTTLKSGKEGTVYRCHATPGHDRPFFAVKVYRGLAHRTFRNDAIYREGRGLGYGQHAAREQRAFANRSRFGREVGQAAWIADEYATLATLHTAGARVPQPFMRTGNAILMEYFGDADAAAPLLHATTLDPAHAPALFRGVLDEIALWLRHRRIHGDLSAYNMLYWEGRLTVIDFPQAVDPLSNPNAATLLMRDVANVCRAFRPYGITADAEVIANHLWSRFRRAEL